MKESRIGVYICWCGTNIAKMVDVEKVAEEIGKLENVVVSRNYKYMCSDPGQELIVNDIRKHELDRVVVAACSPRIHELTFRKALENAGLNQYLFEMANIREHVSWVHSDREVATGKAADLVRAALRRVSYHEPLDKLSVDIDPATLIIGGGVAGMSAALRIAESGNKVYLVEKDETLGGQAVKIDLSFPYMNSVSSFLQPMVEKLSHHENVEVFCSTTINDIKGYVGNFETEISVNGSTKSLSFGHIIVATGLKTYDPTPMENYGYGRLKNIVTSIEFEEVLKSGKILTEDGKTPQNVAIIHCVGSRNSDYHEYCSRNCCATALKYANQLRSALPDAGIFELYADMRAFGKGCEELYAKTSKRDIMFLMFDPKRDLPEIREAGKKDKCNMIISMKEQLSGEHIEVPADMVILMTAVEAREEARDIAHAAGISMCGNDFYIEKHPKLDPVATTTDGVFIVGACQGPKDIPESISQAWAAAARVMAGICRGSVAVEVTTAVVNEDICCGCQTCVSVCPYTAITFDEEKNVSVVNEILCKGCGTCGSTCPTGAIRSRHFTDTQILSQIEGMLNEGKLKETEKIMEEI
ncbi:MAG: CoB--CoM heterodisulfide reductase iron-sulfur subunit A family protein [Bacteroidales bacterium]|jgi:heterodisulfide reductase subunit A|nr:CoB--CoM heterodisulfide reductase iron-sulfur subunit A family protein [Bacteroidales bacterium]